MYSFRDYINGKNVIIVGPSNSLEGKGLGKVIDSYDIVIRINRWYYMNNHNDYGSRCDVYYVNGEMSRSSMLSGVVRYCLSVNCKYLMLKGRRRNCIIYGIKVLYWKKFKKLLAGTYIIRDILKLNPRTLTIAGIDCYSNGDKSYAKNYNSNFSYEHTDKIHDVVPQRDYIKTLINRGVVLKLE